MIHIRVSNGLNSMVATLIDKLDISFSQASDALRQSAWEFLWLGTKMSAHNQLGDGYGSPRSTWHVFVIILRCLAVLDLGHVVCIAVLRTRENGAWS